VQKVMRQLAMQSAIITTVIIADIRKKTFS